MKLTRFYSAAAPYVLGVVLLSSMVVPALPAFAQELEIQQVDFTDPIDGLSIAFSAPDHTADVRSWDGQQWTAWQLLTTEEVADSLPGTKESQPVLFPRSVHRLEIRARAGTLAQIHPMQISSAPAGQKIAASGPVNTRIISRSGWGADTGLLFSTNDTETPSKAMEERKGGGSGGTSSDARIETCNNDHKKHPKEFEPARTVRSDEQGKPYRWALQYSSLVRLLVVHHTALTVLGDTRSGIERMRALYQYHAANLGWGDIGYHYVIDEEGRIFEGKHGGAFIIGGHAYCNNIGTIGIALMGNFELEEPSQAQVKSLQWLSRELAAQYNLDLGRGVVFHGREYASPIIGHEDLLSTLCPGFFLKNVLSQVLSHARSGFTDASVVFPTIPGRKKLTQPGDIGKDPGVLLPFGRTSLTMNPGGKQRISLTYRAGKYGARAGSVIANVTFSNPDITLFLEDANRLVPLRRTLSLTIDVPAGEEATLSFIVQAPPEQGTSTFSLGSLRYTLTAVGRRSRLYDADTQRSSGVSSLPTPRTVNRATSQSIRVRLSLRSPTTKITFPTAGSIGTLSIAPGTTVSVSLASDGCRVERDGKRLATGSPLLLRSSSGEFSTELTPGVIRYYSGALECRTIGSELALINQLSLEQYMLGLAEEPDTEHQEKQEAFAIAARTYAAYYLDPQHRKFAGMPFDASDDPRSFQAYTGQEFARKNPRWAEVVRKTFGQVLTYQGQMIKPPYFHSSDGRTRSPEEAGWKNFPFAEIFRSKPDPWCKGMALSGHGVGMSGCGALAQAKEGKTAAQILQYYYPGTTITLLR